MRGRWVVTVAAMPLALAIVVACSSASTESTPSPPAPAAYDGAVTTTCSTGPARVGYPPFATHGPGTEQRPACVARCGGEAKYPGGAWGSIYSLGALPSGPCDHEGEVCAMTAGGTKTCFGVTRTCDLSGFECACAEGSWSCVTASRGAGVCSPCDAGPPADASSD